MMTNLSTTTGEFKPCELCSDETTKIYHYGRCPKIKSIEYYPDGQIKKIEFRDIEPIFVPYPYPAPFIPTPDYPVYPTWRWEDSSGWQ